MGAHFSFHYHQTIYINKDTNEAHIELCTCNKKGFTKKITLNNTDYQNRFRQKYYPIYENDYDTFFN